MGKIILGSASPRRAELMRRVCPQPFEVVVPGIVEDNSMDLPPEDLVAYWSAAKADEVSRRCAPDDIIITADTVVWRDGEIFGKPKDGEDAFRMLRMLSGNWHSVYTSVTIKRGKESTTEEEVTSILFRKLTDSQIRSYIATGEPMDKAGAYGIQDRGALLCERVEGDFYNVMGLPVYRLSLMLERFGLFFL